MTWLFIGAFVAGWIDAVIGGGGLVLVPLLMGYGIPPTMALATNKVAGFSGTVSAAITLIRKFGLPKKTVQYIIIALVCAGGGALAASVISTQIMRPFIIGLLLAVGIFVAIRPEFGTTHSEVRKRPLLALLLAGSIAFYDGIFGPGTGMFLIMVFTAFLTGDFLRSSVLAKLVNACTNLGALFAFAVEGQVLWKLGLGLAIANIAGGLLGAKTLVAGGAKFIRVALLALVVILVGKLLLTP
ncbi:TSUP family transporter [Corynebacterium freiburgense]|uniref:TSUP family transporter n=1 Tax=Corynebacterium freiburgense TaxID=556548 RepID=UPI000429A1D4|nr:TSUP family transporter [Corynebacterium freiburgense]WJZ01367.1 hypothetical protein CFREI_00250 [Corynebacterium freiburgense]